mmetsp:Transcript_2039/g.6742  ORF Transcript_2039/g.6742 Transcript_2039/m.6742 type:complete len:359 (-) Transcript_2039:1084-2160(-)
MASQSGSERGEVDFEEVRVVSDEVLGARGAGADEGEVLVRVTGAVLEFRLELGRRRLDFLLQRALHGDGLIEAAGAAAHIQRGAEVGPRAERVSDLILVELVRARELRQGACRFEELLVAGEVSHESQGLHQRRVAVGEREDVRRQANGEVTPVGRRQVDAVDVAARLEPEGVWSSGLAGRPHQSGRQNPRVLAARAFRDGGGHVRLKPRQQRGLDLGLERRDEGRALVVFPEAGLDEELVQKEHGLQRPQVSRDVARKVGVVGLAPRTLEVRGLVLEEGAVVLREPLVPENFEDAPRLPEPRVLHHVGRRREVSLAKRAQLDHFDDGVAGLLGGVADVRIRGVFGGRIAGVAPLESI